MNKDFPPIPDIYVQSPSSGPLRQGELITGLLQLTYSAIGRESIDATILPHDYALVVSQDCDLDWDYSLRYGQGQGEHKRMQDILFCVVSEAAAVRRSFDPSFMNSRKWDRISGNTDERFHFFQRVEPSQDVQRQGLPELVADFKLYFSLPVDSVYNQINAGIASRWCHLKSPYLEHCSHRFGFYQGRIALPHQHESLRNS
jgi:hypothetical protein